MVESIVLLSTIKANLRRVSLAHADHLRELPGPRTTYALHRGQHCKSSSFCLLTELGSIISLDLQLDLLHHSLVSVFIRHFSSHRTAHRSAAEAFVETFRIQFQLGRTARLLHVSSHVKEDFKFSHSVLSSSII